MIPSENLKKLKVENSREFKREFEHSGIPGIPIRWPWFPPTDRHSHAGGVWTNIEALLIHATLTHGVTAKRMRPTCMG